MIEKTENNVSTIFDVQKKPVDNSPDSIRKSAQDFEAYFMGFVMEEAYKSVDKSDLLDGSNERDMYQSWFLQEATSAGSKSGHGFGLADFLVDQVNRRKGSMEALNSVLPKNGQLPDINGFSDEIQKKTMSVEEKV